MSAPRASAAVEWDFSVMLPDHKERNDPGSSAFNRDAYR